MLAPLLALLALAVAVVAARRHQRAERAPGRIAKLDDDTSMGAEGSVRSVQVGELVLLPAVRSAPPDTLIVADGFSCREQIAQATGRRAVHLAEALQQGLR